METRIDMHAWEAIQNSLNTIDEHLSEDINIESLANDVALSPYYFQRLFHRLVKKPVNKYIKLRRLSKASKDLTDSPKRIMDIALDCGFSSHAGFTRAFTEAYGISPEEYRHCPLVLNQFVKPDLSFDHGSIDENVPRITDGIVVEVTRKNLDKPLAFIGISHEIPETELSAGQATGVDMIGAMWQNFHLQKAGVPHLRPGGNELGVLYKGTAREGCFTYMTGAEAGGHAIPEGYSSFTLSCGDYIVCKVEAENFAELIGSAIYKASSFMRGWIKQHGFVCGSFAAEMYFEVDPDASYMELWLPVRPAVSSKRPEMVGQWDRNNGDKKPSFEKIDAYVDSDLWNRLRDHIEIEYQSNPALEFSKCSAQHGWNIKYRKAGRTLCTLYPMAGHYLVLIVIGQREQMEFEKDLPLFSAYLQQLYHETKSGMGQKWLMIDVRDAAVMEDVKRCIAIRRGKRKSNTGGNDNDHHFENSNVRAAGAACPLDPGDNSFS